MHNSWGPPQTCTCCCRPLFLTIWLPYKVNYHHLIRLPFNLSFLWSPDHLEKWCRPSGNKSPSCCPYMSNLEPRWRMRMTCLGVAALAKKAGSRTIPQSSIRQAMRSWNWRKSLHLLLLVTVLRSFIPYIPLFPTGFLYIPWCIMSEPTTWIIHLLTKLHHCKVDLPTFGYKKSAAFLAW